MYSDTIADMFTRVRNGYGARKANVSIPYSKVKESVLKVMSDNGVVGKFVVSGEGKDKVLTVDLLFKDNKPVVTKIIRVSTPGRRMYSGAKKLPYVLPGYGLSIVSTSKGVMTAEQARKQSLGGEVICKIW